MDKISSFSQSTNNKKISLNAAFKSEYGKYLEPFGFKLIKSKYPYFVRIIDNEIIQTISITKEKSLLNKEYEGFSLCTGLSLITEHLTNFDKNPMTLDNQGYYTCDLRSLYHDYSLNFDIEKYPIKQFSFFYKKGNNEEMLSAMQESQQELMPFVLDFFDMTKNLDSIYKIVSKMLLGCFNDVILLTHNVDEFIAQREKALPEELKILIDSLENNPFMRPLVEREKAKVIENHNSFNKWFSERKVGGAEYDSYMKQANEKKIENLAFFQKYLQNH